MILTSAQADAYRATIGPQPTVFIKEDALSAQPATMDDAQALAASWGAVGDTPGGRPGGWPAGWLFGELLLEDEAVADTLSAVRHRRYADELLQVHIAGLERDYATAAQVAQANAAERDRPQLEAWKKLCNELANHPDPRAAMSTPPRPEATRPDMTAALKIREQIRDVQREWKEVDNRRQALVNRACEVLANCAMALSRLLYLGPPRVTPHTFDPDTLYESYDVLEKHQGPAKADAHWDACEKRWNIKVKHR